jgi:hypothetical protein
MESEIIYDLASAVKRFKMYPYFDIANYILMCMSVREENLLHQFSGSVPFSRLHPLSCWFGSMMLCFAGGILGNFLLGEPLLAPFKNDKELITATIVWYLINYAPFDFIYKFCKFSPIKLIICLLKEIQRTNKVHHGILFALRNFPGSYILVALFGILKGSASQHMRLFQRLVCGVWQPAGLDILKPAVVTKASCIASILFLLDYKDFIDVPDELLYLSVVVLFIVLRVVIAYHVDPFAPFENLFCTIFMGGVLDSLKRAAKRPEDGMAVPSSSATAVKNNLKAKDD